jgi:hypothetical protein
VAFPRAWVHVVVRIDGPEARVWVLAGVRRPGLEVVEALARSQLHARRAGGTMRLAAVCPELAALLELVGLRGEVGWEPEAGEHPLGVEERVDLGDLTV